MPQDATAPVLDETTKRRSAFEHTLVRELPYIALLVLGLFGVCWAGFAHRYATLYWVALTPVAALICVGVGWHRFRGTQQHMRLVLMQIGQWACVVAAMWLVSVSDLKDLLNDDATGLMMLTLLALGVSISAITLETWQFGVVALFLAAAVPTLAWVEAAAATLFVVGTGLVVVLLLAWYVRARLFRRKQA